MRSMIYGSQEYVSAAVTATVAGQPYNPTGDVVQFAFTVVGAHPTVWYAGSWDPGPLPSTSVYTALCLVGPSGTVNLAAGDYEVYIRITDNPETPIIPVGMLSII